MHGRMKSHNTSSQAGQAHFNRPGTGPGYKSTEPEVFSQYSAFHLWFVHSEARMPNPVRLSKRFHAAGTNERLDFSLSWRASKDPLKRPYKI